MPQTPLTHTAAPAQTLPQPPQFEGSVEVSVQPPPHSICGAMHRVAQTPRTQAAPPGQTLPHIPQLPASELGSMQRPPHEICPGGHAVPMQVPAAHISPRAQRRPQAPQFAASVERFVQPDGQMLRGGEQPGGGPQRPRRQICPVPQRLPQRPQLVGSIL